MTEINLINLAPKISHFTSFISKLVILVTDELVVNQNMRIQITTTDLSIVDVSWHNTILTLAFS